MRIKIAVLAIVAFVNAGIKTAIFQQRNGLCSPNLQRRHGRIYKCEIQRNLKNIFADLYHLFVWTVTYVQICAVICHLLKMDNSLQPHMWNRIHILTFLYVVANGMMTCEHDD